MLPELRRLLSPSPTTKLHSAVSHVAFGPVHEAHEAVLVLGVVEMRVWVIWVEPRGAKITKMRLALRAGLNIGVQSQYVFTCSSCRHITHHVVTSHAFLARYRAVRAGCGVLHDKVERGLVLLGQLCSIAWLAAYEISVP